MSFFSFVPLCHLIYSKRGQILSRPNEIQDSERERELRELFALKDPELGSIGSDAIDEKGIEYELKSTTVSAVSTGRDVGLHTIREDRKKHRIFGKYVYDKSLEKDESG